MSHPRTVLTADAWENLDKRYLALMDEYKAHQEIINQDNVYQRFFAKVEEQYATLIKARSEIPTADAMVEEMKWEEEKHLDIIKRNEEIISRINDSKQIQKYSALITNLRPLTQTIEEQTEQIKDKEAQITALSQENKSTNFGAKTARNLFNIEILKRDIRTLEADKKRNLDLLCNKINQSGERRNAVDPTTAYDIAISLLRHSEKQINDMANDMKKANDWLSRQEEILSQRIASIKGQTKDAEEKVADLFKETDDTVSRLSDRMTHLRERERLINDTQKKIAAFDKFSIPIDTPAGNAFKAFKDTLFAMQQEDISAIVHHSNSRYQKTLDGLFETINSTMADSLKAQLDAWENKRKTIGETFAGRDDMPGPTREEIRKLAHTMQASTNGIRDQIMEKIRSRDFAGASTEIETVVRNLNIFETNIARQISEAVRTPEYKAEVKRQEEKREEVREEGRQQVEKMQADKRNRLSELDQKTVQFLQLVRDHNPKLADKIEINEDPAILEKIRTQMRAKKSIGFLQKGYRFFGALGLKEQFILPPGMLKIEARDKTYTVSLTPQEKALLGVIFSPEKAKTHRLKIFEKATAEAHNRGNNKPPSIRRP